MPPPPPKLTARRAVQSPSAAPQRPLSQARLTPPGIGFGLGVAVGVGLGVGEGDGLGEGVADPGHVGDGAGSGPTALAMVPPRSLTTGVSLGIGSGGGTVPRAGSPPCSPQMPSLMSGLVSRPRCAAISISSPTPSTSMLTNGSLA